MTGHRIGRDIALRLAEDGFDVAVNDVEVGELQGLVEDIKLKGRRSSIHVADVSVESSVKKMVENVVEEYGGLDVVSEGQPFLQERGLSFHYILVQMVANAGIGRLKTILECKPLSRITNLKLSLRIRFRQPRSKIGINCLRSPPRALFCATSMPPNK